VKNELRLSFAKIKLNYYFLVSKFSVPHDEGWSDSLRLWAMQFLQAQQKYYVPHCSASNHPHLTWLYVSVTTHLSFLAYKVCSQEETFVGLIHLNIFSTSQYSM